MRKRVLLAIAWALVPAQAFGQSGMVPPAEEVRVLVRPAERVELRSDIAAAVAKAPFDSGMRFQAGETLIAFDCRRFKAELSSARAVASAAAIELRNKRRLLRHGAAGKSEVSLARAEAARADADVRARSARMADCTITAPFAGRVVERRSRVHEMPRQGEPLMVILDDSRLELEIVVPSRWLTWLKPGADFTVRLDETGTNHAARVERLGAEVDAVSQTVRVFGRLKDDAQGVLAGMSGRARFRGAGS